MTGTIHMRQLPEWGKDVWQAEVTVDGRSAAIFSGYSQEEAFDKGFV